MRLEMRDKGKKWWLVLIADNGEVVLTGETLSSADTACDTAVQISTSPISWSDPRT